MSSPELGKNKILKPWSWFKKETPKDKAAECPYEMPNLKVIPEEQKPNNN